MPQFVVTPRVITQISGGQISEWKDQEKVSSLVGEIASQAKVYLAGNPGGLAVAAGLEGFVNSPLAHDLSQRWNQASSGNIGLFYPLVVLGPKVEVGPTTVTYKIGIQPISASGIDDGPEVPVGKLVLTVDYVSSIITASGDPVDFDHDISENTSIVVIDDSGTPRSLRLWDILNSGDSQNAASAVRGLVNVRDNVTVRNTCARLTDLAIRKTGLNRVDAAAYLYWAYLRSPLFLAGSKLPDGSFAPCLDDQQLQIAYNRSARRAVLLGPEPAKDLARQVAAGVDEKLQSKGVLTAALPNRSRDHN
jgi:hypothetical protein